jgi:hypothetical protein
MRFTYQVWRAGHGGAKDGRLNITTRLLEIGVKDVTPPYYVVASDNMSPPMDNIFMRSVRELNAFRFEQQDKIGDIPGYGENRIREEMDGIKSLTVEEAVDGGHYKAYIDDMQWIDAMSKLPTYRDPKIFKGAVMLQVRKYLGS